jgi:hypothetical protein
MGGAATLLVAAWLAAIAPTHASEDTERVYIVDFTPRTDADTFARELCLRFGCTIEHIYRYVPGMAIRGGNLKGLERAAGVSRVEPDLAVSLEQDAPVLIGAPSHGPLAVVSGGLDDREVAVDREWTFAQTAAPSNVRRRTTQLISPLADRMPSRTFWAFNVLAANGEGRLSDLLAALEQIVSLRYAVGAIYIPLRLHGEPSPRFCTLTDQVLRRGLLVITGIDRGCSPSAD